MNVRTLLMILIPLLAAAGTLILSLGQPQRSMAPTAIFAAGCSFVFVDWLGWFRLPTMIANIAAAAAMLYTYVQFTSDAAEHQLVSVSDLLVYLQTILLFQTKSLRIYWQVFLLSLLEVVVAAALSLGPQFGLLLIAYLFLAIITAILLFVRAESQLYEPLNVGPQAEARQWPLSSVEIRYRTEGANAAEAQMWNRQLVHRAISLGFAALAFTTLLFFLMPRFGSSSRSGARSEFERTVGFAGQVRLGHVGQVLENPEIVIRVQFTTPDGKPYSVLTEPYLRGQVVADYRPIRGLWTAREGLLSARPEPLRSAPVDTPLVHQTLVLETVDSLFTTAPVYWQGGTPQDLAWDPTKNLLWLDEEKRRAGMRYTVVTTAFRHGMQRSLIPLAMSRSKAASAAPKFGSSLEIDEQFFPELIRRAEEILTAADVDRTDHRAICRALESHFRYSREHDYSLRNNIAPPRGVDPIEYFVAERHAGHCEYFASALALMLRSQGVPARLVLGFRGGDYNAMGHYFLVRQLHAHAWVEAYLPPEQVDPTLMFENEPAASGAWLTLDPTPGGDSLVVLAPTGWKQHWRHLGDFLELMWKDYVVGLNSNRQRTAIYVPLVERTSASLRDVLFNPDWWQVFLGDLVHRVGLDSPASFRKKWITWRSVPLLAAIFFGVLLLRRVTQLLWPRLAPQVRTWMRIRRRLWNRQPQLRWFAKLERNLARKGHRRPLNQTPQEYLSWVVAKLAAGEDANQVAIQLANAYYRIRFGYQRLDVPQLHAVERLAESFQERLPKK